MKPLLLPPLESISLLGRPCTIPILCSASPAASVLFLIPSSLFVPTQVPVLGCHLSVTQLSVIPAVNPVLLGIPSISRWAGELYLPRLLIFQTPMCPWVLGRLGSGQRDLQPLSTAGRSSFSSEACVIETCRTDVILSYFGSVIAINEA